MHLLFYFSTCKAKTRIYFPVFPSSKRILAVSVVTLERNYCPVQQSWNDLITIFALSGWMHAWKPQWKVQLPELLLELSGTQSTSYEKRISCETNRAPKSGASCIVRWRKKCMYTHKFVLPNKVW